MDCDPSPPSLHDALNNAVASLLRAKPLLSSAYYRDCRGLAPTSRLRERLTAVCRSLEDASALEAEEAGAGAGDGIVRAILRQHDVALVDRSKADGHHGCELPHVEALRREVRDLERALVREDRRRERLEATSGAERAAALEKQRLAAEAAERELQAEVDRLSQTLSESIATNRELDERIWAMKQEHKEAIAENDCAREVLGDDANLESYRRTKGWECEDGDECLAQVRAECEAEMAGLAAQWERQQTMFQTEMSELEGEARSLKETVESKRSEADGLTARQSAQLARHVQDFETQVASEKRRLQETRTDRSLMVKREVVHGEQRLREAESGTRKTLETQLGEVSKAYCLRSRQEARDCEAALRAERRAVEDAKAQAARMEKHASRLRTDYKGHVVKSGTYVRDLDPRRKSKLMELWTKA